MSFTRMHKTRMNARAIKRCWPIGDGVKAEIITQLMEVLKDPSASHRERIAAAQGLLAAESQNQKDEHKILDVGHQSHGFDVSAIAEELGIDPALIGHSSGAPTGDKFKTIP